MEGADLLKDLPRLNVRCPHGFTLNCDEFTGLGMRKSMSKIQQVVGANTLKLRPPVILLNSY